MIAIHWYTQMAIYSVGGTKLIDMFDSLLTEVMVQQTNYKQA
jgi:hypothetical protein